MPDPTFVVIYRAAEEGWMLERFTDTLATAGDTWHQTQDDARGQAEWEYGERLGHWLDLGSEATDLAEVLARLGRRRSTDAD